MKDEKKTKKQLIDELTEMRQRIAELEKAETERKRAEEALAQEQNLLRALMDNIPDYIYFKDRESRFIRTTKAHAKTFGLSDPAEAIGKTDFDFFSDEHARQAYEDEQEIFRTGEPLLNLEERETWPDRPDTWVLTSKMPLRDAEGNIIGTFSISRDITERKRAEEEISHRSKQLALINEVGQRIAPVLELTELYQTVVEAVQEKFGYQYVVIFSVGDNEVALEAIAGPQAKLMPSGYTQKIGEGMVGWVAQTGETLLANDVTKEPRFLPLEFLEIAAELDVPIRLDGKTTGVLAVDSDRPNIFTEADVTTLETIADQVARAIENARLFEAEQHKWQEAETLRQAAQALSATLDLQQVFELILSELQKVVPYNSASVQLLKGDRLEIIGGHGFPNLDELLGISFPVNGDNPNRQVVATRAPFIVEDAPTVYGAFGEEPHAQAGIRAFLGVPLLFGDRLIGMIALGKRVPGFYIEEHARLAMAFAAQAAVAIENARLYEETQKRLAETTTLHKVAEIINSTLDLKEVFQRVVDELSNTFGYRLVDIYLLEEEGLRLQANVGYDDKTTIELISLERGVIGRVARTGQSAFIRDVSQDPDFIPSYPDIASEIAVPIKSGETLLGVLNVECDECRLLAEDDLLLLVTLSSHIGVAIENARLYEEEQRRSTQRHTIAEVGRRTASILEMDALLPQVVDLIAHNFGYYYVNIFQIDPDSEYAVYKAATGKAGLAIVEEGLQLKVGEEGIIGWVAGHGQPLLVNDVGQDPRYYPHPALPDTRSELAVPIRAGGGIIGVLDVQSTELNAFDEGDLETLQTLADQLAVAIENARLYEETQKRLAETTTLHKVAEIINSTLDLKEVFQRVVDELSNTFGYRLVDIYLLEEGGLRLQANVGYDDKTTIDFIPLERGVIGRVARTGQPAFIRDVSQDPDYIPAYPEIKSEICVPVKSGETLLGTLNVECDEKRPLTDDDLQLLSTLSSHIGVAIENARLYEETQRLAITDGLTGLYNLRYFYEALEKEIQRSERYHRSASLIILDIDDFKAYNDLYGHLAGDDLLKELAQLMSKVTRRTDTLARYGGEEFVIILPETEIEEARFLAERLLEEVREHRFSMQDGQTIGRITISLGVATYPHHADSPKALVDAADRALLRAKGAGKNRLSVCGEELTELEPR